jgi:hypothetical protein
MLNLTANQDWIIANTQKAADGATAPMWLNSSMAAPDTRHEAILFIKPEVTMLGTDKLPPFLSAIDKLCAQYDVEMMNIGTLGWQYLSTTGIINEHYGVIGNLAANGMKALTPELQAKVRETFPGVPDSNIMGALQFLQANPNITAEQLGAEWETHNSTRTKKLAPGTHTQPMNFMGSGDVVVFVGFFPLMAAHFTAKGRSIIAMPVRSNTKWETLRNTMIGDTDPALAVAGSFRAELLEKKDAFGMSVVNKGLNGSHLSAGPLEGMVEVIRFTSNRAAGTVIAPEQTNFGHTFIQAGGTIAELQTLMGNPLVSAGGKTQSAFDATEHRDMSESINLLRDALKMAA